MRLPRGIYVALALLALGATIAGCGGSNATGDEGASDGDVPISGAPSTTLDLAKSAQAIEELKSFRFDFTMKLDMGSTTPSNTEVTPAEVALLKGLFDSLTDVKAEGAYVAPDKTQIKVTVGDEQFETIDIAGKSWVKAGNSWELIEGLTVTSSTIGPGGIIGDLLPATGITPAKTSRENVNGVNTTRYTFDKNSIEQLVESQGESLDADFKEITEMALDTWVADNGVPVKISMSFAGKDDRGEELSFSIEMNIRDMDSNSIQIKAPS